MKTFLIFSNCCLLDTPFAPEMSTRLARFKPKHPAQPRAGTWLRDRAINQKFTIIFYATRRNESVVRLFLFVMHFRFLFFAMEGLGRVELYWLTSWSSK